MSKIAEVVLPLPVDKSFSYSVPEALADKLQVGVRVEVPFGKRRITGYVIKTQKSRSLQVQKLKDIIRVIDQEQLITDEVMKLCRWVSSYYICPLGKVLQSALPVKESFRFQDSEPEPVRDTKLKTTEFFLPTPEQKQALELIQDCIDKQKHCVVLLEGPHNSGKTEVYLQAIAHTLDRGKKVLVLVPEISLTSVLLEKFRRRFVRERIVVFHSGLRQKEHDLLWNRIRKGDTDIVIGTRSAVFSPVKNLGLIVIDGEENPSFKEEKEPRYHAREVAIERARISSALLVLESCAPSVESHYRALKGKYKLCRLSDIPGLEINPGVEIVDRKEKDKGQDENRSKIFSSVLLNGIRARLEAKERVLLFLNRRGFARLFLCRNCGKSIYCPNCEAPLSFHQPGFLLCHHCNYRRNPPQACPSCNSTDFWHYGIGTQQVCAEVKKLFPDASVERFDTDIFREERLPQVLKDFNAGKIDILVGTQMVAGEDISGVSLLGVLLADMMLNIPDFRSAEQTFQILMKLIQSLGGEKRCTGSGQMPGVVIQTYNPNHYIFQALKQGGYEFFFREEMRFRRRLRYPPFSHLCSITISGRNESGCAGIAEEIIETLKKEKEKEQLRKIEILGPMPAPIPKIRGKYKYEIMLKGRKTGLDRMARILHQQFSGRTHQKISVDIDPVRIF